MHSSRRPMPRSSRYQNRVSTKKCYTTVIKRQKSCFKRELTEFSLFHRGGGVLRQELSVILTGQFPGKKKQK